MLLSAHFSVHKWKTFLVSQVVASQSKESRFIFPSGLTAGQEHNAITWYQQKASSAPCPRSLFFNWQKISEQRHPSAGSLCD